MLSVTKLYKMTLRLITIELNSSGPHPSVDITKYNSSTNTPDDIIPMYLTSDSTMFLDGAILERNNRHTAFIVNGTDFLIILKNDAYKIKPR